MSEPRRADDSEPPEESAKPKRADHVWLRWSRLDWRESEWTAFIIGFAFGAAALVLLMTVLEFVT